MNLLSKYTKKEGGEISCPCTKVFELCTHAVTQTHYWHLMTTGYAEHKALNMFYDELPDLMDVFIETFVGVNGRMKTIPAAYPIVAHDVTVVREYFSRLHQDLMQVRPNVNPHLQSELDNILTLVAKTNYLLTLS